jgi:type IV pilus assembly protein PilC
MALFTYVAKDEHGKTVNGALEYEKVASLIDMLRTQGLVILSVKEERSKTKGLASWSFGGKVKLNEIVIFTRQLATMVEAGIPIVQSLDILKDQTDQPSFKTVISQIKTEVEKGESLSFGMSQHKNVFGNLYIQMVLAGETSGSLNQILERLATYLEKTDALIRKIKSVMTYPFIVSILAFVVVLILFVKVIPVFEEIYQSFDAQLPLPTQTLIRVSDFLVTHFFLVMISIGVAAGLFLRYIRTTLGRRWFDRIRLKIIIFGPLMRKVAISKFCRTLATLVKSGVPIVQSLAVVAATSGNTVIEHAVLEVKEKVREGEGLAGPLKETKIFPSMVVRMIAVGEEAGELDRMLNKISDFYESQVDAMVAGLTALIEPLIIAFLGTVIGGIVICMFLPMFKLWQVVTSG